MSLEVWEPGTGAALAGHEFTAVCRFLVERTGIELKPGKESMVMGRLDRRLRHHGLTTYTQYLALLASGDEAETQIAVDLLTTNETYFFREPAHFEVLGRLAAEAGHDARPYRVWSAAASTGEEAYTIAMTLDEHLPPGRGRQVIGTDISTRVLATARTGVYPLDAAERIPRALLQTHCLRGRDEYEGFMAIGHDLRRHVQFREANLLDLPADLGVFDVVFLRNVMIYFGPETKQDLVDRVSDLLRPGGHLIISHVETLSGMRTDLEHVMPSVYRRPGPDR